MANTDGPFGFRPIKHLTGGRIRLGEYSIASAYDTDIFSGDVVEMTGTGKNVAKVAAGNVDNIGVFAGCHYVNAQGEQVFSKMWPADTVATNIVALVYDDPNIVFEAQVTTIAEADVGQLADLAVGTGNASTGISGAYIDGSAYAATGKSFRVMGLVNRVKNAYGAYAKIEVSFAEHVLSRVVAGVGGN